MLIVEVFIDKDNNNDHNYIIHGISPQQRDLTTEIFRLSRVLWASKDLYIHTYTYIQASITIYIYIHAICNTHTNKIIPVTISRSEGQ